MDVSDTDILLTATPAFHGNTLQHATHTATRYDTLQHATTHCNTLRHTATHQLATGCLWDESDRDILTAMPAPHCITRQHNATHCITRQHTATHCNTPAGYWVSVGCVGSRYTDCSACTTPHHTASHCNTLQHTATHCNTQLAIGCLWDVSDRDIDRFADALFRFGGLYLNQVSLT